MSMVERQEPLLKSSDRSQNIASVEQKGPATVQAWIYHQLISIYTAGRQRPLPSEFDGLSLSQTAEPLLRFIDDTGKVIDIVSRALIGAEAFWKERLRRNDLTSSERSQAEQYLSQISGRLDSDHL